MTGDSSVRHGTFITEERGVGFVARCLCGWRNSAAGYDYGEAVAIEGTHAGPALNASQELSS